MTEPTEVAKQVTPIWKCEVENCNLTFPPTLKGYRQMKGHQLRHANEGLPKGKRGFHLEDEKTGEVLARSINEAMSFLTLEMPRETKKVEPPISVTPPSEVKPMPTPPPPVVPEVPKKIETILPDLQKPKKEPPAPPPEAKAKEEAELAEKRDKVEETTVKTAGTFTYEITLPADAFTLFNLAKACGLEPNPGKLFDEWIWDCVRARFSKDYKKQLILAPVEE